MINATRPADAVREEIDAIWAEATPPKPKTPVPFQWASEIKPVLDNADFVERLLCTGAMSVVYGESNCGKTFFATDLAFRVATGRLWNDLAVEAGTVIYVALEGAYGVQNRIAALRQNSPDVPGHVSLAIISTSISLTADDDTSRLIETIKAIGDSAGKPVNLIVVDTLSRALGGGNENSPEDMGRLVKCVDRIRFEVGAHVMLIHHSGKDTAKGARGHSLLRAAIDTEIEVSRSELTKISTAKVMKQRDLPIEGVFGFKLKVLELGNDRRGKPVTSCVVEPTGAPAPDMQQKPLSGNKGIAIEALHEALVDHGNTVTGHHGVPVGASCISDKSWRDEFYARKPGDNQEARRKAFNRARDELVSQGRVCHRDGLFWIPKKSTWKSEK